jgi:hypothetical protein
MYVYSPKSLAKLFLIAIKPSLWGAELELKTLALAKPELETGDWLPIITLCSF